MNNAILEELLFKVEKPSRYIGKEVNSIVKSLEEVEIRFAFAFPDLYEVGMSHLGMHILYNLLNEKKNIFCERVFAPWTDMESLLREKGLSLFTLETHSSIRDMDFLGFTLQYELSYTNIINMLDLGGIPLKAVERTMADPFIIAGGPCAYNPEPLADIVDIFVLGEGEEVILEILDQYKVWSSKGKERTEFLEQISSIEGVYIPSLYEVIYDKEGKIEVFRPLNENYPVQITKRIIQNLDEIYYPEKVIVPFSDIVHDRAMVEIFRGCTRGCRFCQAGMIYRPLRERSFDRVKELAHELIKSTGYEELSLSSLSTSDYSQLENLVRHLIEQYGEEKVGISLPSLRLDSFSMELIQEIQKVRKTGLTFAPEAGTQRLRDVINKGVTEEDLISTVEQAFMMGWNNVKLYFMIGLPTETYKDLDGIVDLAHKVIDAYYKVPKDKRNKGLNVTISTSSFVPKAFTPFQWEAQDRIEIIKEKQNYLKNKLRHKNIKYSYHQGETSFLEGVFARGDRQVGQVLLKAWEKGCKFDGWQDFFQFDTWMEAFTECNIVPEFYTSRGRSYEEKLPWDHIQAGINKEFLIRESEKAKQGILTQDCRINCSGCGINEGVIGGGC
ncbi:MAG: TIGR03960 family B12-binding radical SAM protein [Thermotaleaceae bacterium]